MNWEVYLELSFGQAEFKKPVSVEGGVKQAAGYMGLQFRGKIGRYDYGSQ